MAVNLVGYRMPSTIFPGALVRHPDQADWGIGQVQSVIEGRITVNFEDAGKRVINGDVVALIVVGEPMPPK